MSQIRTLPGLNDVGFDKERNVLVVPVRKTASLYLVDTSVLGTGVEIDDESVAQVSDTDQTATLSKNKRFSTEERTHPLSRLNITGKKVGTAMLSARRSVGSDNFDPVTIQVVDNPDSRQSGDRGAITPEFRDELLSLSVREAVLRVAEDQMYSSIGRKPGGFGRYADKSYDWCGAFAWYCWNVACSVHGVTNPFGEKYGSLLSCQKAVSWALQTDSCTILRYKGGDPYGNSFTTGKDLAKKETQEYIEISDQNPVMPADIVIMRLGTPAVWKHVCLAAEEGTVDQSQLMTLNGNMTINGSTPSITKQPWNMKTKVNNGKDSALIYLHVHGFDE